MELYKNLYQTYGYHINKFKKVVEWWIWSWYPIHWNDVTLHLWILVTDSLTRSTQGRNHWRRGRVGVGVRTPQHFNDPQLWTAFYMEGGRFSSITYCNKVDYFKIYLSTIHQIERFEVRNSKTFLGRGSPSPLPRPLLLGLRPRFGLRPIRTSNFWSVVGPLDPRG